MAARRDPGGERPGNARSVARLNSLISNAGEVDGIQVLSPATIGLIFDEQSSGIGLAAGLPVRFGIGFALPLPRTAPYIPPGRRCFWFGWGGAIVVNALEHSLTMAYVMNKMGDGSSDGLGTDRTSAYTTALSCAGVEMVGSGSERRSLRES